MARVPDPAVLDSLTPREREVLELLRRGLTDREIGEQLGVSTQGATFHVSAIIRKLGVRNRYEASTWPERPPWWMAAFAPYVLLRRMSHLLPLPVKWLALVSAFLVVGAATSALLVLAYFVFRQDMESERPHNVIVVRRNLEIWIVSGDNSFPPRPVSDGSVIAQYVGHVERDDGGIDLYYLDRTGSQNVTDHYALFRADLDSGDTELAFDPTNEAADLFLGPPGGASISFDSKYLLYGHGGSIEMIDLATGDIMPVASPACETDEPGPRVCLSYFAPKWSPKRDIASALGSFLEASSVVILRPFEANGSSESTVAAQGFAWAPSGDRLCAWTGEGVTGASMFLVDATDEDSVDLLALLPDGPGAFQNAYGCTWSSRGELAVGYAEDFDFDAPAGRIAVLDESFGMLHESEPIDNLDRLDGWLPDGSGVIFSRRPLANDAPRTRGIYMVDSSSIVAFPLRADVILDVIP